MQDKPNQGSKDRPVLTQGRLVMETHGWTFTGLTPYRGAAAPQPTRLWMLAGAHLTYPTSTHETRINLSTGECLDELALTVEIGSAAEEVGRINVAGPSQGEDGKRYPRVLSCSLHFEPPLFDALLRFAERDASGRCAIDVTVTDFVIKYSERGSLVWNVETHPFLRVISANASWPVRRPPA